MAKLLSFLLQVLWRIMYLPYVFLHELSHAVAALLLTRHEVTVYIGSYGESRGHLHFSTGRLHWRIKYNFFEWKGGVCMTHTEYLPPYKKIIYALMGPLLPFVLSAVLTWLGYKLDWSDGVVFLWGFFCVLSFYYMVENLFPSSKPVILSDGRVSRNDGSAILETIANRKTVVDYKEAVADYRLGKYEKVAAQLEHGLQFQPENKQFHILLILCYGEQKQHNQAKEAATRCVEQCTLFNDIEYTTIAHAYAQAKELERALHYYNQALKINPKNTTALNNKGYALNMLGYYKQAIPCFIRALSIRPLFAFSYNNLGYAQLKMGEWEEGFKNLKHSHRLNKDNAYVYRNLGIYFLEKKEYTEALKHLEKAEAIDSTIPELEELLSKARYYASE